VFLFLLLPKRPCTEGSGVTPALVAGVSMDWASGLLAEESDDGLLERRAAFAREDMTGMTT